MANIGEWGIDKSFGISYYIFMDINIFDEKQKNNRMVRVISDSFEMGELLKCVLSPYFRISDEVASFSVVCLDGEAEAVGGMCVYIGNAPKELSQDQVVVERPLDIAAFVSLCVSMYDEGATKKSSVWSVDEEGRRGFYKGREFSLTRMEAKLFSLLVERVGECVLRSDIEKVLWNGDNSSNSADVYICFLRKKLEGLAGEGVLISVRSKGYMLKQ